MDNGERTTPRDSACHRHHVLFGDPAFHKAIVVLCGKFQKAAILDQIGIEDHQVRMLLRLLHDRFSVRGDQIVRLSRFPTWITSAGFGRQLAQSKAGERRSCAVEQLLEAINVLPFGRCT